MTFGDWDDCTVRLDFDDTPLAEVKLWAYRACYWFKLRGFIIFRSSMKEYVVKDKGKVVYRYLKGSYFVIFDRPVEWTRNIHIMNWVGLESGIESLKNYADMQGIKETSTSRYSEKYSEKGNKPIPKVVFKFGSQNRMIKKALETRKFILDSLKLMKKESVEEYTKELAVVSEVT